MSVFYDKFVRHAHGEGLKGHATHYCPGCGHGLAHKYMAEAIEELSIQDRTIAISPVGCSVFLYYYMNVGNSQAAHGRAPVVGLGHKLANPNSIVISYQGDGDLASIGLAEILHVAQLGIPFTVIFINNAIYGMTGGQMAPTTLQGQKSSTSPYGRDRMMGHPLKMAEMVAGLDGAIYVERVALYDNKHRVKAKKAITKAIRLQIENKGFAFVEVLSECPTHLRMSTSEAEIWIKEKLEPVFPLGVKKDEDSEAWFNPSSPCFEPEKLAKIVSTLDSPVKSHSVGFPEHIAKNDIAMKLAGAGGDGAQTAAMLITRAAINEGFDATHIPSYGPESRGGTSYADVHIASEEVLSPAAPIPNVFIAFNAPSMTKFAPSVQKGGTIVYDSSVVAEIPELDPSIQVYGVPLTDIGVELGKVMVKNIAALGALQVATNLFPEETFLGIIKEALRSKADMIPINEEVFRRGQKAIRELKDQ